MSIHQLYSATGSLELANNFYTGVCALFWQLGIDGQDVVDSFIHEYLEHAHVQANTQGEILIKSGFSRDRINKFVSGQKAQSTSSEKNVFHYMVTEVKAACSGGHELKIRGKENSFYSIFKTVGVPSKSLSAKSILDNMASLGLVDITDRKTIIFRGVLPTKFNNTKEKVIQVFCDTVGNLCSTLSHNMNEESKLFQRSYTSFEIPEHLHQTALNIASNHLKDAFENIANDFEKLERTDTFQKKKRLATDKEIGVSAFLFNK